MHRGEFVFTWIYDLGGEVRMREAQRILQDPSQRGPVEPSKSAPAYVDLPRPLVVSYPARTLETDRGTFEAHMQVRLHDIGAVAVSVRVPFSAGSLEEVHRLSHLRLVDGASIERLTRSIADEIGAKVQGALVETYVATADPEPYLVIVLTETDRPASELFHDERRLLAGLVTGEKDPQRLSAEEIEDNLGVWFRYYEDDLVLVDWERAVVIEPTGRYDDVLTVMELANLELLELRVYDRYLDVVLEAAYDDLTRFYGRGGMFRSARHVQQELSNARIDLVRVTDGINNIGKIFGDHYLAKLHLGLAERFHLKEWETIVREKMATLNELYTLASDEVSHRRGIALEAAIVLLFIIDLVLLVLIAK